MGESEVNSISTYTNARLNIITMIRSIEVYRDLRRHRIAK